MDGTVRGHPGRLRPEPRRLAPFTVSGEPGQRIRLRHAEVLINGELATEPLREAAATDVLTLSGGVDTFEPTLSFHGFRYAEITG